MLIDFKDESGHELTLNMATVAGLEDESREDESFEDADKGGSNRIVTLKRLTRIHYSDALSFVVRGSLKETKAYIGSEINKMVLASQGRPGGLVR